MGFNQLKYGSPLFPAFFFAAVLTFSFPIARGPARENAPAARKADGLPLVFHAERGAVMELWDSLSAGRDADSTAEWVDFTLLRRWGKDRGRPVRVCGRLLRVTYVEDSELPLGGYYDIWFLFDDQPRIPGRLLAMTIPDSLTPDQPDPPRGDTPPRGEKKPGESLYRHERISALGYYYRQVAFSDGEDFYTAPTLAVCSIDVVSAGNSSAADEPNRGSRRSKTALLKTAVLAGFIMAYLALRRCFVRKSPVNPPAGNCSGGDNGSNDAFFDGETLKELSRLADEQEKLRGDPDGGCLRDRAFPWFLLGASLLASGSADILPEPFSLRFWEEITSLPEQSLLDDAPPAGDDAEGQLDPKLDQMLRRIRGNISEMMFIEHLDSTGIDSFWDNWPETFGRPVRLSGEILSVRPLFGGDGSPLVMLEIRPETADPGRPPVIVLTERSGAWDDAAGRRAAVLGCAVRMTASGQGVILAKRAALCTEWRSLGRLGGDESLLSDFPLVPVSALESMSSEERKSALERFPLTERDTIPFYTLLSFVRHLPSGALREEARRLAEGGEIKVTDLFNRPAKFQGEAVTLTGTVKRARAVPISSAGARALAGAERYYELYLYTGESQGYPVVCCVTSLPDRFPLGVGGDYHQNVTLSGILYKLWGYKASAAEDRPAGVSPWVAVPLLFAGDLAWYPEEPSPTPGADRVRAVLVGFFILAVAFVLYRRLRRKEAPIRFSVGNDENMVGRSD